MNTLQAVNIGLEWIQQPPSTALDTGGTSDEAEAETILDRVSRDMQGSGWAVNTEEERAFGVPDTKIAVSGGSGTFEYGETVTESVSGATGTFDHILSGYMYLNSTSGTFTGGQTLTGGTSGATKTGGAYTAITTSRIAYNEDEILRAVPSLTAGEAQRVVPRGGFFYDVVDNTYEFTTGEDLTMRIVRLLDIDELPDALAMYIAKEAALSFLQYKMPGRTDAIAMRTNEVARAKVRALQENGDMLRINMHDSRRGREMLGDRLPAQITA